MIDVLINNVWTKMTQDELQFGSDGFAFEAGLYETMRTMDFKLIFLRPHLNRLFSTALICTGMSENFKNESSSAVVIEIVVILKPQMLFFSCIYYI